MSAYWRMKSSRKVTSSDSEKSGLVGNYALSSSCDDSKQRLVHAMTFDFFPEYRGVLVGEA
jgi:hypothetical protein